MCETSSQIYHNLHEILHRLTRNLADMVLERVTKKMDMNNSFTFAAFFNYNSIPTDSRAYHVFHSEHYREKIFQEAENILRQHGYRCRFDDDVTSRLKRIHYDVRVIHPLQRIANIMLPLVIPVLFGYGVMYVTNYLSEKNEK
jgi:hypothetical protein